jgi:hypothetical protein
VSEKQSKAYVTLKEKWGDKHTKSKQQVWSKHAHALKWTLDNVHPSKLVAGSLGGLMLLHVPASYAASLPPVAIQSVSVAPTPTKEVGPPPPPPAPTKPLYTEESLKGIIAQNIPSPGNMLSSAQINNLTSLFSTYFKVDAQYAMDGITLNTNYGIIGAEQHLMLFPGDTIYSHFLDREAEEQFLSSGIAPHAGAWGYFAQSKSEITQEDRLREEYYVAIPTFLAPGYAENVQKDYNFFKFRKLIMVNPDNGKAMVVDIGDSGPSPYTGKQAGGSPEVMHYLGRVDGTQRGSVLYFFINDPNNTVPLGPINIVN